MNIVSMNKIDHSLYLIHFLLFCNKSTSTVSYLPFLYFAYLQELKQISIPSKIYLPQPIFSLSFAFFISLHWQRENHTLPTLPCSIANTFQTHVPWRTTFLKKQFVEHVPLFIEKAGRKKWRSFFGHVYYLILWIICKRWPFIYNHFQ